MQSTNDGAAAPEALRERALERIRKRRDLYTHLAVYLLVNGVLTVIWAMTSTEVFFWPLFAMLGWGVGLVMHAWDVFFNRPVTESEVEREIERMTHR